MRTRAPERFDVASAGTDKTRVNPLAIRAMAEVGIDIGRHTSKTIDEAGGPWDYVVTVCDDANERCPIFPAGTTRLHWSFPDPSLATGSEDERLATFRRVRDAIRARLDDWLATAR